MSQVDFYMSQHDEDEFLEYALGDQALLLFRGIQPSPSPDPIPKNSLSEPSSLEERSYFLVPRERAAEIHANPVPLQPYCALDAKGPVIRWVRSKTDARGSPDRGRLSYSSERRRRHDVELAFRRLAAWIRSRFRKVLGGRAYAGPEAWELLIKHSGPRSTP